MNRAFSIVLSLTFILAASAVFAVACGDDSTTPDSGVTPDTGVADTGVTPDAGLDAAMDTSVSGPTTARARLEWLVGVLNAGAPLTMAEATAAIDDEILGILTLDRVNEIIVDENASQAPFTIQSFEMDFAETAVALVDNVEGAPVRFTIDVAAMEPNRITNFGWGLAEDLDADRATPQTVEEIFINVIDWEPQRLAGGIAVELLRRTTGASFVPAVTGTTNAYGFVRLVIPEDVAVAMRFTHPDGTVTDSYIMYANVGGKVATLAAFSAPSFGTFDPSRAQIRGLISHRNGILRTSVGCATLSSTSAATVEYVDLKGIARPDATGTDPDEAWYAVRDVTETTATLTATAGGEMVALDIPEIIPGHFVTAVMLFEAPTVAENPTPRSCYMALPDEGCAAEETLISTTSAVRSFVRFENTSATETYQIHWLDFEGERVFYADALPGRSRYQQTYVTHPWVITTRSGECVSVHLPSEESGYVGVP